MAEFYDEINILINGIVSGQINTKEAEQYIDRLKNQYGADAFPSFDFQKRSEPWDKVYFRELQKKSVTGACSEEFILHMAEVSEYVIKKRKKIIIGGIIAAIIILLIIAWAIVSHMGKEKDEQSYGLINDSVEVYVESETIIDESEIVFI